MKSKIVYIILFLGINTNAKEIQSISHTSGDLQQIIQCTGVVEVVQGGLSEHNEYSLPGVEVTLFIKKNSQRYSAIVKSPEGSVKVFSDLNRSIYKIGREYEVVGYDGYEQGSFGFYAGTEYLNKGNFEARASAPMPERGWDNMVLNCSENLR